MFLALSFLTSCSKPCSFISNFHPPSALPVLWSTARRSRWSHLWTFGSRVTSCKYLFLHSLDGQWKFVVSTFHGRFPCIFCSLAKYARKARNAQAVTRGCAFLIVVCIKQCKFMGMTLLHHLHWYYCSCTAATVVCAHVGCKEYLCSTRTCSLLCKSLLV